MSYFITQNNISVVQDRVEYMYVKTLQRIKLKIKNATIKKAKDIQKDIYNTMRNVAFMEFFVKWIMGIMKTILTKSVKGHTTDCIVRCSFDLVFRYAFDINYIPFNLEKESCEDFLDLQLEIFRNCGWNILNFSKHRDLTPNKFTITKLVK